LQKANWKVKIVPEEYKTEKGEIHEKFWERTVREAFKNDPFRIIVELIKNAADSYTRLEKKRKAKPPFEIITKFYCHKRSPPTIEVLDNAEGMDSNKLKESLKYGTQTSMGEDIEAVTSAEKGIGLKDAMMALEGNWLITMRGGLLNERNKHLNFDTGIGKEDEVVTDERRKQLGIPNNGTLVMGTFPDYFHERKFVTICERLTKHFLMRKLLQNAKFKVYAVNGGTGEKTLLRHIAPKIERQLLNEIFDIDYNRKKYRICLQVNRSTDALPQGKPFGESGLLFFYGDYSVVDFTLCHFEKDIAYSKCFGEAKMEVETIIRDPTEAPLVDEKRRGLDPEHPFNRKLFEEINNRLREIGEQEEVSKFSFDESTKKDILRELNQIYKEVKGTGLHEPPIRPVTFAFYPVYISIKEYEPKTVSLIINSSIISDDFEISLQSTNPDIIIKKPKSIRIEEKVAEKFVVKQIELYSEKPGARGEIVATRFPTHLDTEKMGVEVLENPIFLPANGFAFVPEKTTIVDGGKKQVDLCIDKMAINELRRIDLVSSDPVNCPGEWLLPEKDEGLEKYTIKNIVKVEIPIKVKGTGYVGEKGNVKASYGERGSNLNITVVSEPSIAGLFRDIRPSGKKTEKICAFLKDEAILEIYYKHPLIKKYMVKNFNNRLDFQTFIADTITREVLRAFVTTAIDESSSRFPIFNMDHPESEIEDHIAHEYYEKGILMHEMFGQLARTFRLGEVG
jgi:hypothetical protein